MASPILSRIDVHHHFIPQEYIEAYTSNGGDPSGWTLPTWSIEHTKSFMRAHSISTTILSLTAPGTSILASDPPAAAHLARKINESVAAIRDSHPRGQFGFFAALPPLVGNTDAVLAEISYALDVLKADGVTLYTRYGPGNHYLGHVEFKPVWKALSERRAVVFIHPTHLADTALVNEKLPQPMVDYPHETCRTAVDLIMSDTTKNNPGVKIILSHAGGTLPYLVTRAAHMLPDAGLSKKSAEEFLAEARGLYYDLALSGNEYTLELLRKFVGFEHVMFGSDFPYAPRKTIDTHTASLDRFSVGMSEEERYMVERGTAVRLFGRLRGEADELEMLRSAEKGREGESGRWVGLGGLLLAGMCLVGAVLLAIYTSEIRSP